MTSSNSKTNIQITPTRTIVIPNDRLSKKLFNLTSADLQYWIEQHRTIKFSELLNHKRFGDIISPIKLFVDDESFTISEPIDPFDRAVLAVCISEWKAGNRHTTPAIIYRALSGKVGRGDAEPSKNQLADILNSLKVLTKLQIDYDMSNCCQKLGYNDGKPEHLVSTLLPACYLQGTTVNGKDATVITFDRESPLFRAAQIKNNQILSFDNSLLDVPHQKNTRMNISLKFYVITRVLEIKLHKQLTPSIIFADVFQKCRILNASRDKKCDARNIIVKLFEHLQAENLVKTFQINKKGVSPYSIYFTF
ncbi:MAG: hypothetical protein SR2Q5_04520 [Quinella sp. 2Q5]|nr:hypothetical protein [Quinella sp. 2Q5]